jgi:hypothetical protein
MREAEITQMPAVKREAEEGLAQAMSVVSPETERSATPRVVNLEAYAGLRAVRCR